VRDVLRRGDQDLPDRLPLRTGLRRDELHPEDRAGLLAYLFDAACELDPAALAPPAGVDLRLDDPHRHTFQGHGLCRRDGLVDRLRDHAALDWNAVRRENLLGLVLVELHSESGYRGIGISGYR
jgi:hypothetical protein